jgi:anti-sigma regulatory factor (Ser/Thr protein kinase)
VVGPAGSRYLTGGRNLPLGVSTHTRFIEEEVILEPGSTLICFTDGLVEARGSTINDGLERLERAAAEAVAATPDYLEALCDSVIEHLRPADHDDDTALVALRLATAVAPDIELEIPASFDELAPLRHRLTGWLAALGTSDEDRFAIVLAACEAATNAIEHGYGPVEATVWVSARLDDDEICVNVRDSGAWRDPRGVDRGRGLTLIEALMDRTEVRRSEQGTKVIMCRRLRHGLQPAQMEATARS